MNLSQEELQQLKQHGLTVEKVERQIENFKNGFPCLSVTAAASFGNGIECISTSQAEHYAHLYGSQTQTIDVAKFVPASGAASRMFKDLFEFLDSGESNATEQKLIKNINSFAFYNQLLAEKIDTSDPRATIDAILNAPLCYGSKPKGQILFHSYPEGAHTAFEEHLCEAGEYGAASGKARIHFTVSPEHRKGFEELLKTLKPKYEKRFGIEYQVEFSEQKSSTDTIAVDMNNEPFRNSDGSLLLRPAGHGALIENLDTIDADVIFVKNIDNLTTESQRADTILYKQALAGMLLEIRNEVFTRLSNIDNGNVDSKELVKFVTKRLNIKLPKEWNAMGEEELVKRLERILNRPIRVCGMVRNLGEPGGGPFMARNADGSESLQIAESSQIAPEDRQLMQQATHFNPVDLVLGVKNYKGEKFALGNYVDHNTGFISVKSKNGRELKAQELPGLWNGAMSDWITLFVEVPVSTFSPVKVVTDLLRPEHR